MSDVEEKPLHEVILDIMYFKNTEKPSAFTPEDIFWQMKDPDISERQIKEVLDWLVVNKKAEKRFGKYQIDKYEFIDIANKYKQEVVTDNTAKDTEPIEKKVEVVKKVSVSKPKPQKDIKAPTKTPTRTKGNLNKSYWVFLVVFLILSLYVGYRVYDTPTYTFSKIELETTQIHTPEELYIPIKSSDEQTDVLDKQMQNISYSFIKQNKTNKIITDELSRQNNRIITLQKELNKLNQSYQQQKENNKIVFIVFLCILLVLGIGNIFVVFRKKK